jgi:hypothetical protein
MMRANKKTAGSGAIWLAFGIVNLLLSTAVYFIFWDLPLREREQTLIEIELMENRLAAQQQEAAHRRENERWPETDSQPFNPSASLPYDHPADALIGIAQAAARHRLNERAFETGEPSLFLFENDARIPENTAVIEWTAEAVYEGAYENLLGFIEELAGDGYDIRRITLEAARDAAAYLRITVCVYGMEVNHE